MSSKARATRVFAAFLSFNVAFGPQAVVLAQQAPVAADANTTLTQSANGTPVVNIATPNAQGVSHNRFDSYDVGEDGLILNNSAANAVSLIGGGTIGNAHLANGSANLILNEVVRANAGSMLRGYQEILGPSAELVIANPWGITCNGCGFVNTPRVTLTTGRPTISNGLLAGFTITGGQLAVTGDGLDASRQSALDLLARSILVDGDIFVGSRRNSLSGDLRMFAGAHGFDYATRTGSAAVGADSMPQLAIDSSALGGMYADRIQLLVDEHGAGVRMAGNLAALADDLTIRANGGIELRGAASAARDLFISGTTVDLSLADADTFIYGGRDLSLTASAALTLGTGSIGAERNVTFGAASLLDRGGTEDLRFAGDDGSMFANISGDLDISGGYWVAPNLRFDATNALFSAGAELQAYADTGTALQVTTPGLLSITGQLFSGADASLSAQRVEVGADGAIGAERSLGVAVARGGSGGLVNAGVLSGDSLDVVASGAPNGAPTTFHNYATGTLFAERELRIGEAGGTSPDRSDLVNEGAIVGGDVTIGTTNTINLNGVIEAGTRLDLRSDLLQNLGEQAYVIGSTEAGGVANIAAATILNEGTIWSDGDLELNPTSLEQRRAGPTNPLIGAGRDLSIAYTGAAELGTGDLQAGRNLTITGTSITDRGNTGAASGSIADLRFSGGDAAVIAAPGRDVDIGGGQWFSEGGLRFVGDRVFVGSYVNGAAGRVLVPDVQILGGWGGTGALAFEARSGTVNFAGNAAAFSGADLTITQQNPFVLGADNILQAQDRLQIGATGGFDNFGVIAGGLVDFYSTDGATYDFMNRSTGQVIARDALRIGVFGPRVRQFTVHGSAPGAEAGLYGGGLAISAQTLDNLGTIQAGGGDSSITAETFVNHAGARVLGFDRPDSTGRLFITARNLDNHGMLFGNSFLLANANNFFNMATGGIGSNGLLQIQTGGLGGTSSRFDNLGEVWGDQVQITSLSGFVNGRDPGNPANRGYPASIFADSQLSILVGANAVLENYGTIESAGDITLQALGSNASLLNDMSMVPASEVTWSAPSSVLRSEEGNVGLLARNPHGSATGRHEVSIDGTDYYVFNETDGGSFAYYDHRNYRLQFQRLAVPEDSIPVPEIRAQGNLRVEGFQSVVNRGGSIGADGDVTIASTQPGSSVSNSGHKLYARDEISEAVTVVRCHTIAHDPVNCNVSPEHAHSQAPITLPVRYSALREFDDVLAGQIYAGGDLNIQVAGTVTNAGATGAFTGIAPTGPSQVGVVTVNAPGSVGSRNGAPTLNLNGAVIPLPASANGRFVPGQESASGPVVETNPLFGIDSIHLGSEYLARLLGLDPDEQTRRLGDDNYEAYLIQEQVQAATGRGVLTTYWNAGQMIETLFDNAAEEAGRLDLGYGKALTAEQIASLRSDIVWMVEQEVNGQKALVPVVYLSDATRATIGTRPSIDGFNTNIEAGTVRNIGGEISATNRLDIRTTGNIENLSGRMAGWNVRLDAGGDIVNSTLVRRSGDAQNGRDIAERTASIDAGNTAVLTAERDINVRGAWVTAGKDAVLIAGRNVNVEAVALTTNQHFEDGDDSYTRQVQNALGAGVVAGGNIGIQGGENVNIRGAEVAAGGTAAIRAERGDVNIGVLELTNSSTSVETRTGRYDQLERDPENGTLGIGMGTERRTTTTTNTTTTGVGSRISGSGVAVSTGRGDVNVTGSEIEAGEDGVLIASADDVNIAAYHDRNESTTSREAVRAGARIDGSYDGVFAGTQVSGDRTTTTTTQTTARTSGISSGGNVAIRGQGDVTNEGTRIDAAGDVLLAGENVINRAAQDTYTTTTTDERWDSKQQTGFTANGTGSSIAGAAQGRGNQVTINNLEAQVRVTGSYSNETNTYSESRASGTEVRAGGNVVVNARNNASDEGTQYEAGKNIVISAENYENRAAADTSTFETERTRASGQITAGLNSAAEVAVTVSGEGGHDESSETQSVARTGSMRAGGAVVVEARSGDVTLEGTQIDGAKGVGITAAGDINLNQANDTVTRSSSGESGSGRLSGSVSVLGTGGSVGAGASARTYENEESSNTARTVSISSGAGNVQLGAGRDIGSQGANLAAGGNVGLSAGRDINLAAATETTTRTGRADGGGADVTVGFGTGAAKGNGSVGGAVDFERSRTDYTETRETGSQIRAGGDFTLNAGRDARLEGTRVDAGNAALNTGGNLTIESAQRTVQDDSYSTSGRVEAFGSKGGGVGGANSVGQGGSSGTGRSGGNAGGGNAQVDVTRSYQDIETNSNASISTRGSTSVNVGGDMTLAGANINAQGGVNGEIAGNLNIESRVDREVVDQSDVKAYAGVGAVGSMGNSTNRFDRAQDTTQAGANIVGQTGVFADVEARTADNRTIGTASGVSGGAGGIDLRVGGDTTLRGAANQSSDFDTQGRTTVESVETRVDETTVDFRAPGTLASALGSDQGKAGEFNASVNIPGDSRPAGPRRQPGANDSDAPGPARPRANADAPNDRPRANTEYANNPNLSRPDTDASGNRPRANSEPANRPPSDLDSAPNGRPRANTEYANNPTTRPRADTEYANNPNLRPRADTEYANDPNLRQRVEPTANDVPEPGTRLRAASGVNAPVRPPVDGNAQRPRSNSDPGPARPVDPVVQNDVNAPRQPQEQPRDGFYGYVDGDNRRQPSEQEREQPRDGFYGETDDNDTPGTQRIQRDDPDDGLYNSDGDVDNSSRPPPQEQQTRVAVVEQPRNRAAQEPPGESPGERLLREALEQRVNTVVDGSPELSALRDRGQWLSPDEQKAFVRNLAEIEEFARVTGRTEDRTRMLAQLEESVRGPRVRDDGLTEFPLHPQYVGEDIDGFDNWLNRGRNRFDPPGESYTRGNFALEPVRYLSADEQRNSRVHVREDGTLEFQGGRMRDGSYIFVIDADGNFIAGEFEIGKLHHSSLSGGRPVLMAGELDVSDGRIISIQNKSGHFRPNGDVFEHFLAELSAKNGALNRAVAQQLELEQRNLGFRATHVGGDMLSNPSQLRRGPAQMLRSLDPPARSAPRSEDDNNTVRRQSDASDERSDYEYFARGQERRSDEQQGHLASDNYFVFDDAPRQAPAEQAPQQRRDEITGYFTDSEGGNRRDISAEQQPQQRRDEITGYMTDRDGGNRRDVPAEQQASTPANRGGEQENATRQMSGDGYQTPPVQQQQRVASAEPRNEVGTAEWRAQELRNVQQAVERTIANDPDASRLRTDGLSPEEGQHARRNVAEILEYTRQPAHQNERAALLARVDAALRGPQTGRDGIVEYPLRAQYIGENLPGFDNWNTRPNRELELPGAVYSRRQDFDNIRYLSANERADAQVFVDRKGRLAFADGTPIRDVKYMFVVDREGRMILAEQKVGEIHHSSLSAGENVRMAGEITFAGGRIKEITNISGHFRPDNRGFERFLADLRRQGVDLAKAKAPTYEFSTNERGQFMRDVVDENLLRKPRSLQRGPVSIVAPMRMPKVPKANRRAEVVPFPGKGSIVVTYTVSEPDFQLAA